MGLGLFRAGPAVLPPWRQCGLGWRRQPRVRPPLGQRRRPPRSRRSPLVGGWEACEARPPPTWQPLAEAVVEPAGGIFAVAERGCSGPLRCG